MRREMVLVVLAWAAAALPILAQKPAEDAKSWVPKKGDEVIVRGCVSGTTLHATGTRRAEGQGSLEHGVTYRLTGARRSLRMLRDEHRNAIVDVRGILKSELPDDSAPGRTLGKSGIRIGMGAPPRGNSPGDMMPYYPVLEVTSFEPATGRCLS